jgi:maleate cis-trans isomerase
MEDGPEGDHKITEMIAKETGTASLSTGQAVIEALRALALKRLVLISPYVQETNDHERDYLTALGFEVLHDVALGLGGGNSYIQVPPERWIEIVQANTRPNADGYFLSCTNTTQIGAIAPLEAALDKPMVNSNQATIWACWKRLSNKLGPVRADPSLGRLFSVS